MDRAIWKHRLNNDGIGLLDQRQAEPPRLLAKLNCKFGTQILPISLRSKHCINVCITPQVRIDSVTGIG